MSRGYRGVILAALCGLILISAGLGAYVTALTTSHSQNQEAEGRHARPSQHWDQSQQANIDRAGLPRFVEGAISNPQPSDGPPREKRDLAAQEATAVFTFWMVVIALLQTIVAAIGIYYIRRTIAQGQESLEHARHTAKAEFRPYLVLESVRMTTDFVAAGHQTWKYEFRLINHGQMPARIIDIQFGHAYIEPADHADFETVPYRNCQSFKKIVAREDDVVFSGGVSEASIRYMDAMGREGGRAVAVKGLITYRGVIDAGEVEYVTEIGRAFLFIHQTLNAPSGAPLRPAPAVNPTLDRFT